MKDLEGLFSPPRNFAGLSSPDADLETAKAVILPVPYDSTTEWHSGTRAGPQAIIDASPSLEFYDVELEQEIYKVGIHTLPFLQPVLSNPESMIHNVYLAANNLIKLDKFPVMFGGEHSLSLGAVQALREKYDDLSVLQLDAHADLRDEYMGTRYNHACVMRRIQEHCPIIQVGIRSLSREEQQFINLHKLKLFDMTVLRSNINVLKHIVNALGNNIYISIDLDVFDPSIMAAVATPEPDGMLWANTLKLLKTVAREKHIVGFDLMELCPGEGPASCAYTAAKLAYKLIGYCLL